MQHTQHSWEPSLHELRAVNICWRQVRPAMSADNKATDVTERDVSLETGLTAGQQMRRKDKCAVIQPRKRIAAPTLSDSFSDCYK